MHFFRIISLSACLLPLWPAQAQPAANQTLPEIPQLMKEVHKHQKQVDKVQENYTFSAEQVVQEIDGKGKVTKTETEESEEFFVNGHQIGRKVKKNGKPLTDHEQEKETARVTKWVEKAEKLPPDKPLEDDLGEISISRLLEIMDVRNERREIYRGRAAIVFDFVGRKNARTHGLVEDVSKKLRGTMWIDEADRQIAHVDVAFEDNFHVGGGVVANIQKGSNFHLDQAQVNGEIWLPTGSEGSIQVRVLLVKGFHVHVTERDFNYKRFHVEAQQGKDAKAVVEKKP